MAQVFADGARAELATAITASSTSFTITSGGELFPVADTAAAADLGDPQKSWFYVVMQDDTKFEVMRVRGHSTGSASFSLVDRISATPSSFAAGATVGIRPVSVNATSWENKVSASAPFLGGNPVYSKLPSASISGSYAIDPSSHAVHLLTASGDVVLSLGAWPETPAGEEGFSEVLIEAINFGAHTVTWPTVNWVKSDGTTTTNFSETGVTLGSSGSDWILIWTTDSGNNIYGKVLR